MSVDSVLITGATGLVGHRLLEAIAPPRAVFAVARRRPSTAPGHVTWIDHDLAASALPASLPERVDAVVHLAQSLHFREFPEQASDIFGVNVASTFQLLDWARSRGVKRFILASTGGVYGHGERPFHETDPRAPDLAFYAASRACAEQLAGPYASAFDVLILRPFFIYGQGQRPDMLIPRLVESVAEGRPIVLDGEDGPRMNPIHVSDAVTAIVRALDLEGSHTLNLAGPEVLTLRQIAEAIGAALSKAPTYTRREAAPRHLVGDTSELARRLGPPRVRFAEGVLELCRRASVSSP